MRANFPSYFIFFKIDNCRKKVNLHDIILLKSEDKYIKLVTTTGNYLLRGTLLEAEEGLHPEFFRRVHRSYIVSLHHIEQINTDHIVLGTHIVPLHKDYTQSFLQRLPSLN